MQYVKFSHDEFEIRSYYNGSGAGWQHCLEVPGMYEAAQTALNAQRSEEIK